MEKEKHSPSYVDVKSICPNWVTDNFLDFMDLKLEDLKDKSITSIGWWFWIFEMDAAKNGAKVTVVDPMFKDKDYIDVKLQENIDWMEDKIKRQSNSILEWIRNGVLETLSESSDEREIMECRQKLDWYDGLQIEKNEYANRHRQLLKHLNNWKTNQKNYWLVLNSSSWDRIEWIDTASQDIVVISHTLWHIFSKSSMDIVDFLEESLKILKPGWRLYIIDYVWDMMDIDKILENTDLKMYYRVNKWSFVWCFDKNWLAKFVENERR